MAWSEIIIEAAREIAESLSDAFLEAGAVSVLVEDADEGTDAERPLFGEPGIELFTTSWNRTRIAALISADADPRSILSDVASACGLKQVPEFVLRPVAEQDWVALTQSQFAPIHIGKNIWVVPSWHDTPDQNAIILELDPGLAFGTGSHPTTRLCMEWLELHVLKNMCVLDYGCGSGILALISKMLGAKEVLGVDIDPQAVTSARENAKRNHCEIAFHLPDEFQTKFPKNKFDVVVANILSSPLKVLAPMLTNRLAPGGSLVLSGILERQAEEVIAAYAPYMSMRIWKASEGWVTLCGTISDET